MRSSKKQEIQVGDLVKWVTMSRTKAGVAAIVHRGIVSSIKPDRTAIVIEQRWAARCAKSIRLGCLGSKSRSLDPLR